MAQHRMQDTQRQDMLRSEMVPAVGELKSARDELQQSAKQEAFERAAMSHLLYVVVLRIQRVVIDRARLGGVVWSTRSVNMFVELTLDLAGRDAARRAAGPRASPPHC